MVNSSGQRRFGHGTLGYSLRREAVDEFYLRHAPDLPAGSRVLDLAGTRLRKRGNFDVERYGLRVIYANLSSAKRPDVVADAVRLPLADASVDAVICAELLEHVPQPLLVLAEIQRVLRVGGTLLLTVPFLFRVHGDPYDYGRYTEHFWRENLDRAGFGAVTIERQGLFWSVLLDMARAVLLQSSETGLLRLRGLRGLAVLLFAALRRRVLRIEARPAVQAHAVWGSYTTGYGIWGVKA